MNNVQTANIVTGITVVVLAIGSAVILFKRYHKVEQRRKEVDAMLKKNATKVKYVAAATDAVNVSFREFVEAYRDFTEVT